jgi:hypothetical protein
MRLLITAALCVAFSASGVAAQSASDALVGRSVRAVAADGAVTVVRFEAGGVAQLTAGEQAVTGAWSLTSDQLCFDWPGQARECWPWTGDLQPGVTVTATSDQGDTVQVTLEE